MTDKLTRGERWKLAVLDNYDLEAAQEAALRLAAEALDRADQAQRELDRDGLTTPGLHSPRAHPCVAIKRDAVAEYLRLTRALGVYAEDQAQPREAE